MQLGINPSLRELVVQPFKGNLSKVFHHLDALGWSEVNTRSSKDGEWSMLSLRGYSSDPRKCGKPAEECAPRIKEGDITFTIVGGIGNYKNLYQQVHSKIMEMLEEIVHIQPGDKTVAYKNQTTNFTITGRVQHPSTATHASTST